MVVFTLRFVWYIPRARFSGVLTALVSSKWQYHDFVLDGV